MLIELISLGVTAEGLRANIDYKSAFLEGVGQFGPNFLVVRDVPCEPFLALTDRSVNALQLCRGQYSHKETS